MNNPNTWKNMVRARRMWARGEGQVGSSVRNRVWGGGGSPRGPVAKHPPASAGFRHSIPGREDPTCRGVTSPCVTTAEPALWSPGAATSEARAAQSPRWAKEKLLQEEICSRQAEGSPAPHPTARATPAQPQRPETQLSRERERGEMIKKR